MIQNLTLLILYLFHIPVPRLNLARYVIKVMVAFVQTRLTALLVHAFTSCFHPGVCPVFIAYHVQKPGIFTWENLLRYSSALGLGITRPFFSLVQNRPFNSRLPHFYKTRVCFQVVELNDEDGQAKLTCLGPDLVGSSQQLQYTVAPNVWFGAIPTKDFTVNPDGTVTKAPPRDAESHYSLVGCTCAPAFQYQDFELAKRSELVSRFPNSEPFISLLTIDD